MSLHSEVSVNLPLTRKCWMFALVGFFAISGTGSQSRGQAPGATPLAAPLDIDAHALAAPAKVEDSLDWLVSYLIQPAQNDRDKARAIFRWMTDRIRYDVDAHMTGHPGHVRPEAVLRERFALCHGYCALFAAMAQRAGLEVVTIAGFARGLPTADENAPPRFNHSWNAVRLDGSWYFVDVTRGAGQVKAQRFQKMFQEQYFLTPPAHMIRTHLPADPRWQLLPMPLTPQQFDALPYRNASFFAMGLAHETATRRTEPVAPRHVGHQGHTATHLFLHAGSLKVLDAPRASQLTRGRPCYFLVDAPQTAQMALVQGQRYTYLSRNGARFEGVIYPEPGELRLCLKRHPQDTSFQNVLSYTVK